MTALLALFVVALLSGSVLPLQSELFFVGMLEASRFSPWLLLGVASAGNTLGSTVNWWLGRGLAQCRHHRWFPMKHSALARAERWFARFGKWSLLLAWLPLVGDPLTVMAGLLRMKFLPFIVLVAAAKTGRYLAIMLAMGH